MYSMNYIGKFINNFREFYNEINGATLTGAIDVVVVEQPDGSYSCSPFHVRFGKLGVLRSRFKVVDLELNGEPLDVHMKLGESGEAFFVEEIPEDELESSAHLATSPIPENSFGMFAEEITMRRRNSVSECPQDKLENQVSEYTQRRYTDSAGMQRPDLTLNIPKHDYQTYKDLKNKFEDYTHSPAQEHESVFHMDDLDDTSRLYSESNAVSAAPGTPKTFRAEELGFAESAAKDVVRKISIHNDFRPIETVEKQHETIVYQPKTDEIVQEECQKSATNNGKKKKKTKKSGTKKKNSQRKSSTSSNSSLSDNTAANNEVENKANDRLSGTVGPEDKPLSAIPKGLQEHHFFSDSEINSGGLRNQLSLSCTPVQSDTELEMSRAVAMRNLEVTGGMRGAHLAGQSWRWGELPEPIMQSRPVTAPGTNVPAAAVDTDADVQNAVHTNFQPGSPPSEPISSDEENALVSNSNKQAGKGKTSGMLSGMFNFMKQRQSDGSNSLSVNASVVGTNGTTMASTGGVADSEGGVYLADLADGGVDPEVAALYFPQHYQAKRTVPLTVNVPITTEEDYESGNGPSLPQSPASVEGRFMKGLDSDEDDLKIFTKGYVGLSMCGPVELDGSRISEELFESESVRWEDLRSDPLGLLEDPRLVVRLGDRYMQWSAAAPVLLSLLVYHRPLPSHIISDAEIRQRKTSEAGSGGSVRSGESAGSGAGSGSDRGDGGKQQRGYSWWSWRRSAEKQTPAEHETIQSAELTSEVHLEVIVVDNGETVQDIKQSSKLDIALGESQTQDNLAEESLVEVKMTDVSMQTSLPSLEAGGYSGSQSSEESDTGATLTMPTDTAISVSAHPHRHKHTHHRHSTTDKFRKSLRLSSDQIAKLNLREGMNEVVFSVTTAYQGTTRCKCHLFRWRYDDKIVISDIDGTITKSDVLGHIFPLVGKDWAQSGVAQLFTKIKNNGYKLLYLSARAIGQAKVTREYLRSIKQGDLSLPDGPLLLNPTSLLRAFHREVIEKKPEEFKIQCLSDIKALFPLGSNPFYAGYGNRVNDVCAYQTVGIPIVRIFTINHKGELKHELTQTFQSSYSNMSYIVDQLFPPVQTDISEDFSQCIYWREPLPTLESFGLLLPESPLPALPTIPEGSAN